MLRQTLPAKVAKIDFQMKVTQNRNLKGNLKPNI